MTTYGYKTYKAHHFVASILTPDGGLMCDMVTAGSRQQAFLQVARKFKGYGKIKSFIEIDPTDVYSMELYGFIPVTSRPARIDWSKLDLY